MLHLSSSLSLPLFPLVDLNPSSLSLKDHYSVHHNPKTLSHRLTPLPPPQVLTCIMYFLFKNSLRALWFLSCWAQITCSKIKSPLMETVYRNMPFSFLPLHISVMGWTWTTCGSVHVGQIEWLPHVIWTTQLTTKRIEMFFWLPSLHVHNAVSLTCKH